MTTPEGAAVDAKRGMVGSREGEPVSMQVLERYFEALRAHDWDGLAECLADDVDRTGPYLDVVRGKQAYVDFLSRVVPTLENYALDLTRIRRLEDGTVLVELSETVDVDGVATEFPEVLLFDLDADDRIVRIDIYIKQPPGSTGRTGPSE